MTIPQALQEVYASDFNVVIHNTIQIVHSSLDSTLWLVDGFESVSANLEDSGPLIEFQSVPMGVSIPRNDIGTITMDNVDRSVFLALKNAVDGRNEPIIITHRLYIASDLTAPQTVTRLFARSISANLQQLTISVEGPQFRNRRFPNVAYGRPFKALYYTK